jgi:hypothetical protein
MRLPTESLGRRIALATAFAMAGSATLRVPATADSGTYVQQPALQGKDYGKTDMSYSDFTKSAKGALFKVSTFELETTQVGMELSDYGVQSFRQS